MTTGTDSDSTTTSHWEYVGQKVVLLLRGAPDRVEGRVYSIDPESGAWLLTTGEGWHLDGPLCAVFPSAIVEVQQCPNDAPVAVPSIDDVLSASAGSSQDAGGSSKEELMGLLARHHLPASEEDDGVVRVLGNLTIQPPYRPQDCRCANEIMLRRVEGLLATVPRQPR